MKEIERILQLAKSGQYKVCMWGAGYVGRNHGYTMLRNLGIKVDFYCDNNEELYGKEIKEGICCINKEEFPSKVICFVMVSSHLVGDVKKQLNNMDIEYIVEYSQLCCYVAKDYFGFTKRNQIAVYTCVVGDYDEICEPEVIEPNCDYYLISDKKPEKDSVYQYINIDDVLDKRIEDNTRKNRYCKINAHKIFPNYKYSIYMDGCVLFKGNMSKYIDELPQTRIIVTARHNYDSIYGEALKCMLHGRDEKERFITQVEKYWLEGLPEDFGIVTPPVMVREHNNPICKRIMETWWEEVWNYSNRDMISLPYALWKNGYKIEDIGVLSKTVDELSGLEWEFKTEHLKSRIKN